MRTASMLVFTAADSTESNRPEPRLGLVRATRAAEYFDVRGLLELLVDRVRGGVQYGAVQYVALLNDDIQKQLKLKRNALHATAFIGQAQKQQLLDLGHRLDTLSPGQKVPAEWLDELSLPLPAWPERNMPGALLLAEHVFSGKSARRTKDLVGLTALVLDLDLHKVLNLVRQEGQDDPLGLVAVACLAHQNKKDGDARFPHQAVTWEKAGPGRPKRSAPHDPTYDRTHPLAGKTLYEVAAGRWRAKPSVISELCRSEMLNDPGLATTWSSDPYTLKFVARYLLDLLTDSGLQPTCVTLSGRGLHLRWRFSEWIPSAASPRWELMQRMLHWLLRSAGSDSNVSTDRARALRVPGTMNARSGTRSERFRAIPGSPFSDVLRGPWLLEDLADSLFSKTRHECRALMADWRDRQSKQAQLALDAVPEKLRKNTAPGMQSMNKRRLKALKGLAERRGGITEGARQTFLWVASCLIRSAIPRAHRQAVMMDYVDCLASPLPSRELRPLYSRLNALDEARNYRLSNRLLCESLDITAAELRQFPELAPPVEVCGAWTRTSRQQALIALLQAGTETRVIEKIMNYRPGTVHVLTCRLYAAGTLKKLQVRLARLAWRQLSRGPAPGSFAFAQWRRRVVTAATEGIDLMRWFSAVLRTPRSPPISPQDKRLQQVLEKMIRSLTSSITQACSLMEKENDAAHAC